MKQQITTALCVGTLPFILSYSAARWHQRNYPCGSPTGSFAELVGRIGWPAARYQTHLATSRFESAIGSLEGDFESKLDDGRMVQFSVKTASRTAVVSAINEHPAVRPGTYRFSYHEPEDEELVLTLSDDSGSFEAIQRRDGTLDLRCYEHNGKSMSVKFERIPKN